MRKTNNNIKRLRLIKQLLWFALAQIILILFFAYCFFDLMPIKEDQTEQVTIEVISTGYWETPFSKHVFTVYSDTDSYVVSNPGIFGKYSNNDLYQSIQQGDVISLRYVENVNVFGKAKKHVVVAQTESQVYRSIEEHNNLAKKAILPFILITFVVEGLFLVVLILFIALHKNLLKRKKHR